MSPIFITPRKLCSNRIPAPPHLTLPHHIRHHLHFIGFILRQVSLTEPHALFTCLTLIATYPRIIFLLALRAPKWTKRVVDRGRPMSLLVCKVCRVASHRKQCGLRVADIGYARKNKLLPPDVSPMRNAEQSRQLILLREMAHKRSAPLRSVDVLQDLHLNEAGVGQRSEWT